MTNNFSREKRTQNLWGLPPERAKEILFRRGKTFKLPCQWDNENTCGFGPTFWKNYNQEYDYTFNMSGYRDVDYKPYEGQKVNFCLGDSFTMNFGGPVEHSWPYQLSKYFKIPTLNLGINGLSSYYIKSFYEKFSQYFDVQNVFILYNVVDNDQAQRINQGQIIIAKPDNLEQKIKILKEYCWIQSAYWQLNPLWTIDEAAIPIVQKHFPDGHDYQRQTKISYQTIQVNDLLSIDSLNLTYIQLASSSWPSLATICEKFLIGTNIADLFSNDIDKRLATIFSKDHLARLCNDLFLRNRDGWHMSKELNKSLANYFYNQSQKNNNIISV